MNDERIAELRRLCEAATLGPWFSTDGCCVFADGYNGIADAFALNKDHPNGETIPCPWPHPQCQANARFIAAARTAVPELLAECERLRAEVQDVHNAWTADLNKRVAPLVRVWEAALKWYWTPDLKSDDGKISVRALADAIKSALSAEGEKEKT